MDEAAGEPHAAEGLGAAESLGAAEGLGGIDWSGGAPRSRRFCDIYFQPGEGLAESRAVFLDGLDLPAAWAGRTRFTVGELGFGTGLNVLALLQRWAAHRPSPTARLHLFSVEALPLSAAEAARAVAAFPELAPWAGPLLAQWAAGGRGFQRIAWSDCGATLDLALMDAGEALEAWSGRADAWMLDGFAPSANPAMWTPQLMAQVAARSAPGARAATFTVAGHVRRGLEAAGFAVAKRPGHGRKRERLEAQLPGAPPPDRPSPRVAVVGAGIAGAALVRALRLEGCAVTLVEREGVGAGASGAAAVLVAPRLDAGFGPVAALHAQALARAAALYDVETPAAVLARGALQLEAAARDAGRFDRLAAWDGVAPGALTRLDAAATARALDEEESPRVALHEALAAPRGALHETLARVVEPAVVLAAWLGDVPVVHGAAAALERMDAGGWRVRDAEGAVLAQADVVVLAAGCACAALAPGLPLEPVRGQLSTVEGVGFTGAPAAWGGYAIPTREGVLFGATHGRGDARDDLRAEDAARNDAALAQGRPALAVRLAAAPAAARRERAAVRAAAPDRSPLAGAVPGMKGVFVLSGLGGRGFTLAPLLAEHVAAAVVSAPSPLARPCAGVVDPARYGAG